MADIPKIIKTIDERLEREGKESTDPVEANKWLRKARLLTDSGKPGSRLRDLLRKGRLPHARQPNGKGTKWIIPRSNKKRT